MANKDWSLVVNVAGVAPANIGAFDRFPTGPYAGKIISSEREEASTAGKADNIVFEVECTEAGEHKGKKMKIWMPIDLSVEFVRRLWKNLLLTVAKSPEALEKGEINIKPGTFEGKPCFVYVEAAAEGSKRPADGKKQYDNRNFVTREQYEKLKVDLTSRATSGGGSTATSNGSMEIKGGSNGAVAHETPPSKPVAVELD